MNICDKCQREMVRRYGRDFRTGQRYMWLVCSGCGERTDEQESLDVHVGLWVDRAAS